MTNEPTTAAIEELRAMVEPIVDAISGGQPMTPEEDRIAHAVQAAAMLVVAQAHMDTLRDALRWSGCSQCVSEAGIEFKMGVTQDNPACPVRRSEFQPCARFADSLLNGAIVAADALVAALKGGVNGNNTPTRE